MVPVGPRDLWPDAEVMTARREHKILGSQTLVISLNNGGFMFTALCFEMKKAGVTGYLQFNSGFLF